MPRLSAVAIRAALIYLLVGFTFGALLLANKGIPIGGWAWYLLAPHVEFLLLGWTAQLILGVAFWILPRYTGGSRGNERLAWLAVALLNAGIVTAASFGILGWALLLLGRVLEAASALVFALYAWGRVRPSGK